MPGLSPAVERILASAIAEAHQQRHSFLGTPHLFIALTKQDGPTVSLLRGCGCSPKAVRDALRHALGPGTATLEGEPRLTYRAATMLQRAGELAINDDADNVEERHLLEAILGDDESSLTLRVLRDVGTDIHGLQASLDSATPILDRTGCDLVAQARDGTLDPMIGRKKVLRQLARTLTRKKKNNPVLVGPAGVGKTAIVEGLATLIAAGSVPDELKRKRLVELPMASLVSGTKYRGEFEDKLLGLIEEVKRAGNIILFIDDSPEKRVASALLQFQE